MDYFSNPAAFLCLLQDYLSKGVLPALDCLYRGEPDREYRYVTERLLASLRVISLLERSVQLNLKMTPPAPVSALRDQQNVVTAYALSLMDLDGYGAQGYGLDQALLELADCSVPASTVPTIRLRVRSANGKPVGANNRFIASGITLQQPLPLPTTVTP